MMKECPECGSGLICDDYDVMNGFIYWACGYCDYDVVESVYRQQSKPDDTGWDDSHYPDEF